MNAGSGDKTPTSYHTGFLDTPIKIGEITTPVLISGVSHDTPASTIGGNLGCKNKIVLNQIHLGRLAAYLGQEDHDRVRVDRDGEQKDAQGLFFFFCGSVRFGSVWFGSVFRFTEYCVSGWP